MVDYWVHWTAARMVMHLVDHLVHSLVVPKADLMAAYSEHSMADQRALPWVAP